MTERDTATDRAAEWVYSGVWQVLSNRFNVPATPPTLPTEAGETPDAFKPTRGHLRYMKLEYLISMTVVSVAIFIGWVVLTIALWWVGLLLFIPAALLVVAFWVVGYIALHLKYDTTWYVMTDRSLRIRRGIWVIREMTFTFENVQNVKVRQGPLQRMFGVSDLLVETAGAGADPSNHGGPALNQGVVQGVADAWALRDRVLAKLKTSQTAGFGDDLDAPIPPTSPTAAGWSAEHLAALRSIRDELGAMTRAG